jgi:glycosyltransferase involved in cell wall biosynthesis
MGIPVVGFAVGGVPEIVVDGTTGMLCPPDDVAALGATMREAIASRAKLADMGEVARRRVVDRFSVGAMAAGYAAVYEELGRP